MATIGMVIFEVEALFLHLAAIMGHLIILTVGTQIVREDRLQLRGMNRNFKAVNLFSNYVYSVHKS